MKITRSAEMPRYLECQLESGLTVTMHREDIVIQLEAFGYSPAEAFRIVCRAEDGFPLALKVNTKP